MRRISARIAVALFWLPGLVFSTSPASACACGAIVSSDSNASVNTEVALVDWDGHNETVLMQLSLQSNADNAALVVPTPHPASVAAGNNSTFDELDQLSAPHVESHSHWTMKWFLAGPGAAAPPTPSAPTVVSQVQLGPLQATTLAGGDMAGLTRWLATNGYTMRPAVVAALGPYVRDGWSFVAMRLTSHDHLNGRLNPVTLKFASDRFVYPMRMSVAAQTPQHVVIYTLGQHRMRRVDPDQSNQVVDTDFAGPVSGVSDPALAEFVGSGAYLTKLSTHIQKPDQISSDFEFAPAATDDNYQQVENRTDDIDMTPAVVFALAVVIAVTLILVVGRLRRKPAPNDPPGQSP
jgi:hypothetical protein